MARGKALLPFISPTIIANGITLGHTLLARMQWGDKKCFRETTLDKGYWLQVENTTYC